MSDFILHQTMDVITHPCLNDTADIAVHSMHDDIMV